MLDLTTLSDADLAAHLNAVLAEQERRQALATIPTAIADLRAKYLEGGGDPAALETHSV